MNEGAETGMTGGVTFGQILNLIDSDDEICLMDNSGKVQVRDKVCSEVWKSLESSTIGHMCAIDDYLLIWLD